MADAARAVDEAIQLLQSEIAVLNDRLGYLRQSLPLFEGEQGLRVVHDILQQLADPLRWATTTVDNLARDPAEGLIEVVGRAPTPSSFFADLARLRPPGDLALVEYFLETTHTSLVAAFEAAFWQVLEDEGVQPILLGPPEFGSFRRKSAALIRDQQAIDNIAGALETAYLRKPQSDANLSNASAIGHLLAALTPIPDAAIRLGSLLLVKLTLEGVSRVVVTELTEQQIRLLGNHPAWLTEPHHLLERLGVDSALFDEAGSLPTGQ